MVRALSSYLAAGSHWGVSDNAIRKWIRWYGAEPPKKYLR